MVTANTTVGRVYAVHRGARRLDTGHGHALDQLRTACTCTLRERHRRVDRIGLTVARYEETTDDTSRIDQRVPLRDLGRREYLELHAEAVSDGRHALDFVEPVSGSRHRQAAATFETSRLPRLLLELCVQLCTVAIEFRQRCARTQLHHETGGVPGRAARERAALEQHNIGPAEFRQVIRDARADDPAADDHDARMWWKNHRQRLRIGFGISSAPND